jgi:alpha-mannosidase
MQAITSSAARSMIRIHLLSVLRTGSIAALAACTALPPCFGQTMKAPDITKVPTLYVVPYAHLDTQWRWDYPQVISEYLAKTMLMNFSLIDKYPHYVFNWTGANRYRLMKEYYPGMYARVTKYVAAGRWFPAGSSIEEGDVNLPTAEGIFRQVLYGNLYFEKDFGKASNEFMLPDSFGFPASLPSILKHAGLKGFNTTKLAYGSAAPAGGPDSPEHTPVGYPFNVGLWIGPDGNSIIAAINPGPYGNGVTDDLSADPTLPLPGTSIMEPPNKEFNWVQRIDLDGKVSGVYADYHYIGTGDTGGAVREESQKLLEAIIDKGIGTIPSPPPPKLKPGETAPPVPAPITTRVGLGPVHVIESAANQMFDDIKPEMQGRLPTYTGDIELVNHSAGSLTSEAYHKRWVLKNELVADNAEKASVAALWMGGRPYPQTRLNDAWMLSLSGHFHDTGAGTATPQAYKYAWNDDLIAANQFVDVFADASKAVVSGLDTRAKGLPVVVFNPLNIAREDVVEAAIKLPGGTSGKVRVLDPQGNEVPSQVEAGKVLFLAKAPSVGYAVYDLQPASGSTSQSALKVTASWLENQRYRVSLDQSGDVSSIFDKLIGKELLSGPIRLAISEDFPSAYPAWNMDFKDEQTPPRAYVSNPARVRVVEDGPVRVAVEVSRQVQDSTFVQTVRLSAGDPGNRVEFTDSIDWRAKSANLKVVFPLTASNQNATYNEGIGTIQRPNEQPKQFEVSTHNWIDLTDQSGGFGATVLTDFKHGSDKPDDKTLRLTLMRSPGVKGYTDQATQDWGHHDLVYGIAGHAGDWRVAQTDWQGYRLNDPLVAFEAEKHAGTQGKSFSLVHLNSSRVRVLALKKAERSDELIIRLVELDGKPKTDVHIAFAGPVASAHEVSGQEKPVGPATVRGGELVTSFTPYQPRTFAVTLGRSAAKLAAVQSQPVALQYELAVASNDDTRVKGGGFDGKGNAMPAEMLPASLTFNGVMFQLGPAKTDVPNAIVARGQEIHLPAGNYNRVYLLAASAQGDQKARFRVGSEATQLTIQSWNGFVGQWDTRVWKGESPGDWAFSANHTDAPNTAREKQSGQPNYPDDYIGLVPGYIKPATLAWYASHHHTVDGLNEPYQYAYLFAYSLPLPTGARTLTLPANDNIRVLAISVAQEGPAIKPVQALYDTMNATEPPALR